MPHTLKGIFPMDVDIHESWQQQLTHEFKQPYFDTLIDFVQREYSANNCFPAYKDIFAAFNRTSFNDTKVIIIGQDPYHGLNQANGLCFSVLDGVPHPPSLKNIFKEIALDLGKKPPKSGNLEQWADQGVLLLNATLTVRAHEPGSHQKKGWEQFTDAAIAKLSEEREDLIFLLWGGFAKKKASLINQKKHAILTSGHPSPLSANRGYWFGNKHFSKVNEILRKRQTMPIKW